MLNRIALTAAAVLLCITGSLDTILHSRRRI